MTGAGPIRCGVAAAATVADSAVTPAAMVTAVVTAATVAISGLCRRRLDDSPGMLNTFPQISL
jgi:hypothetical protein